MNRITRVLLAGLLGSMGALAGCSAEEAASCGGDKDCTRGEICEEGACTTVACDYLGDCPGSGRTCLYDLARCSAKECDGAIEGQEVFCSAPLSECVIGGNHRSACIEPGTYACQQSEECVDALGEGYSCCEGFCGVGCGGGEGGALVPADEGVVTDMGVDMAPDAGPDSGPVPEAHLCSVCAADAECAGLGEGAQCTAIGEGAFCTSACDPAAEDCPTGFLCAPSLNQCIPASYECAGCLVDACVEGEVCDVFTGDCQQPQPVCGRCTDDSGCEAGLTCGPHEGGSNCFAACDAGSCDAGYACVEGLCTPESGPCDACAGVCGGETPFCDEDTGQCHQCGAGAPCPAGLNCDVGTHTCVDNGPGCQTDIDCVEPSASVCFGGQCVACLDDTHCPARHACDENFQCIPAACGGVTCQAGSICDPATGRCEVGCNTNMDCAVPEEMECNQPTGQCYYTDHSCDLAGTDGVCAPGGRCIPGLITLGNAARGNCTCLLTDPADVTSEPIVGCHPGEICFHFELPGLPAGEDTCSGSIF